MSEGIEFKIITHKCETCGKIIGSYVDDHVQDWDAAEICTSCFKKYKEEVEMLLHKLMGKRDIYTENKTVNKPLNIYEE